MRSASELPARCNRQEYSSASVALDTLNRRTIYKMPRGRSTCDTSSASMGFKIGLDLWLVCGVGCGDVRCTSPRLSTGFPAFSPSSDSSSPLAVSPREKNALGYLRWSAPPVASFGLRPLRVTRWSCGSTPSKPPSPPIFSRMPAPQTVSVCQIASRRSCRAVLTCSPIRTLRRWHRTRQRFPYFPRQGKPCDSQTGGGAAQCCMSAHAARRVPRVSVVPANRESTRNGRHNERRHSFSSHWRM